MQERILARVCLLTAAAAGSVASWIGALLGAIAMALGATSARVLRLVMRQCARLAALGVVIGVVLVFVVMVLFRSAIEMHNVSIVSAGAFAADVALVVAAAALAAYFPARRATRIDPSQALRADA